MSLAALLVNHNTCTLLVQRLQELHSCCQEIVVVDNGSTDGSADLVARDFPGVRLVQNERNLGFAAAANQALELTRAETLLFLSPRARLAPDAIERAEAFLTGHPRCGSMGGRLLVDGNATPLGRRFPSPWRKFCRISGLEARYPKSRLWASGVFGFTGRLAPVEVDWFPLSFALIKRQMLDEIGLFDERFFLYFEEIDLYKRARQRGWQVVVDPSIEVELEGEVSESLFRLRSELLYMRKHYGFTGVLSSSAVEIGWHTLYWLGHLCSRQGRLKAAGDLHLAWEALEATRWGTRSPPTPW